MKRQTPSLYGIKNSNRDYSNKYYWGKNQFNSSFPIALSCYMRDKNIKAIYISATDEKKTTISEISFDDIFGTTLKNEEIRFEFETVFEPYAKYVEDSMEKIDVVIKEDEGKRSIRALEVKLTTLPDDSTSGKNEEYYGTEIVVRSPTMRYMALSMVDSCGNLERKNIRNLFAPVCNKVRDWENLGEMNSKKQKIFDALERFLDCYHHLQQPLVLQPIWKTIGKSSLLSDDCLDVFVWSNFALARLFLCNIKHDGERKIPRPERAALRLARFLYEWSARETVYQAPIYDGMTFDTLNDKEFAVSGSVTNPFMVCERLKKPIIKKDEIKNIIFGGGQKYLSPERRFDAIIYFSNDLFKD